MKTSDKIKRLKTKCDKLWSEAVRTRDGECVLCGKKDSLSAHHWIHSKAQGNNQRWNIKNGITLCFACHIYKVHTHASAEIIENLKKVAFERGICTPEEFEYIANDRTILKGNLDNLKRAEGYLNAYLEQLKGAK